MDPFKAIWRTPLYIALTLLLTAALIISSAGTGGVAAAPAEAEDCTHALLHRPHGDIASSSGVTLKESYEAFSLVEATREALDRLSASGVRV